MSDTKPRPATVRSWEYDIVSTCLAFTGSYTPGKFNPQAFEAENKAKLLTELSVKTQQGWEIVSTTGDGAWYGVLLRRERAGARPRR